MDAEYLIRIILRARDEMGDAFASARGEVSKLRTEFQGMKGDVDALNTSLTGLNTRLTNLRTRVNNLRGDIGALRNDARSAGTGFDSMSSSVDSTNQSLRTHRDTVRDTDRESRGFIATLERWGLSMQQTGIHVKSLGSEMRGLLILGVIGFFQQLATAAIALGGNLLALASSAAYAGAALGGTLAAGATQALPALGLLIAAFQRVGVVMDALKQRQNAMQQEATQAAESQTRQANAADRVADAHDQVVSAQERLSDSHRRVGDAMRAVGERQDQLGEAQRRLTQAREDAADQLEDLILQEERAELQAKGASLSIEEAQRELTDAIAEGDNLRVRQARLGLESAQLASREANQNLQSTRRDAQEARRLGVDGDPGVQAAQRGVEQARRGIQDARRSVEDARRGVVEAQRGIASANRNLNQALRQATEAEEKTVTAQRNLEYLLGTMSEAEQRLYRSIIALQDRYAEVVRPITDIIVNSFARTVDEVAALLGNERLLGAFEGMATGIAEAIDRITDAATSNEAVEQWIRIIEMGTENLGPITDVLINFAEMILDIGEAAGPALADLLEYIVKLTDNFAAFLSAGNEDNSLDAFFQEGVVHLQAWLELIGAVINLFAAFAGEGGGADSGLRIILRITDGINGWAASVRKNAPEVQRFFRQTEQVLEQLWRIVKAVALALFDLFDPSTVEALANILIDVVLPAIVIIIDTIGVLVKVLEWFLTEPFGGMIGKMALWAGVILGVWRALTVLIGLLGTGLRTFAQIGGFFTGMVTTVGALRAAFTALTSTGFGIAGIRAATAAYRQYIIAARQAQAAAAGVGAAGAAGAAGGAAAAGAAGAAAAGRRGAGATGPATGGFIVTPGGDVIRRGSPEHQEYEEATRRAEEQQRRRKSVRRGVGIAAIVGGIAAGSAADPAADRNLGDVGDASDIAGGQFLNQLQSVLSLDIKGWVAQWSGDAFKLRDFADTAEASLRKATKEENVKAMQDLSKEAREMAKAFPDSADALREFADRADKAAAQTEELKKKFDALGDREETAKALGIKAEDMMDPDAVRQFIANIGRVNQIGIGSVREMRENMAFNMEKINEGFTEGTASWQEAVALNWGQGIAKIKEGMKDGVIETRWGMREINRITREQMRYARDNMDNLSWEAKERLSGNLRLALDATIEKAGGIEKATGDALRTIRRLMADQFELFGLSAEEARTLARNRTSRDPNRRNLNQWNGPEEGSRGPGRAMGGFIGLPGERGADEGFYALGRGEAVLTGFHQAYVNPALQAYYGHGINEMFDRTRAWHAGPGGGYATGRRGDPIVGVPGFPGERAARSILDEIAYYTKTFGLRLTDAYGQGHKSPGHTQFGTAADLAGPDRAMDAAVKALVAAGYKTLYDGRFGSTAWPGHGPSTVAGGNAHIHVEFGSKTGTAPDAGALAEQIGNITVRGARNAGLVGLSAQLAVDSVRDAANTVLSRLGGGEWTEGNEEGGHSKGALSIGAVRQIIGRAMEIVGVPGGVQAGWMQMAIARARQESNFDPNAANNWDINAKNGDPSIGLFQTIGATQRAYSQPGGYTDQRNPLHSAVAAFRYMLARYGGGNWSRALQAMLGRAGVGYASGGVLDWMRGLPGLFVGHGGEWVVNDSQKAKLAGLTGLNVGSLKQALGFSGGPNEFQGGGELPYQTNARLRDIRKGDYDLPPMAMLDPGFITVELRRLNRAIDNIKRKAKESLEKFTDRFITEFDNYTREGGLFDQMEAAMERTAATRATRSIQRRFERGPGGIRSTTSSRQDIAAERSDLLAEAKELQDFRDQIQGAIDDAGKRLQALNRRIKQLRRGGTTAAEEREISALQENRQEIIGAQRQARDRLRTADRSIAENMQKRFEARISAITDEVERVDSGASRSLGGVDRSERIANLLQQSTAGFDEQRSAILQQQAKDLQTQANRLRQAGDRKGAQALEDRIADINTSVQEIAINAFLRTIENVNNTAARQLAGNDRQRRIADALGNTGLSAQLAQQSQQIMANQIAGLSQALEQARARGATGIVAQLEDQIADLQTQIQETTIQLFNDSVSAINDAASRRLGRLDTLERGIGLGVFAGTRAGIFAERGNALRDQQAALQERLAVATQMGNITAMQDLEAQILELTVAIAENTEAARQARIDAANQRASFIGGAAGSARGLIEAMASLSGGPVNQQVIAQLIQTTLASLATQAQTLRDELGGILGVDIGALNTPEQVQAFMSTVLPLIDLLPENIQSVARDLVNGLLQNATATIENTEALEEAMGQTDVQSWSSSAWQMYRSAVFNGAGGLFTNMPVPGAGAGGGASTPEGVSNFYGAAAGSNPYYAGREGDIYVTVNEAGRPVDPLALGKTIMWEKDSRGRR